MTDSILKTWSRRKKALIRGALFVLAVVATFVAASQTACSKKVRIPIEDTGPVRVAVLPFMVPSEKVVVDKELQWTAMAAPALLIKASRRLPDIEMVPFWEVMPVAIAASGASRRFTDDDAATIANWMSAQWVVMGEIRRAKQSSSYTVVVDFIPASSTAVPFRHIKTRRMENIGTNFYLGLRQWLRYATRRPIPLLPQIREPGLQRMRSIGEALDKEYGWLVPAQPGVAQAAVDELLQEDEDWTKLMFSPTMYPFMISGR